MILQLSVRAYVRWDVIEQKVKIPQPQLIYRQPKAIGRVPINQPPVYMRVPPNQAKNWRKHCKKYNACDERVLFVRDNWYNREYAPRYQEQHGEHGNNNNRGHGRKHWNNVGNEVVEKYAMRTPRHCLNLNLITDCHE